MIPRQPEPSATAGPRRPDLRAIAALLLLLVVVTAIRVRLLDFPLERDEGEFAYAGQLLLHGITPYQGAYNVALKLPGTTMAYALIFAVLGQTTTALHAGLILVNLATAWLVFLLARRVCGDWPGAIAAGTYGLLSITPHSNGLSAHATHFVMLPAVAGILLLQDPKRHGSKMRMFLAGLLLGVAVLMKQTGGAFGLFGAVWVTRCELQAATRNWRALGVRLGWLAVGGALPLALTGIIIAARGEFGQFWFWGFEYAQAHAAIGTVVQSFVAMWEMVARLFPDAPGLWVLALAGLILIFRDAALQRWRFFILSLAFFSFVAVLPGWRGHYYIQLMPAAGLLAGVAVKALADWFARREIALLVPATPYVFFIVAMATFFIGSGNILFSLPPAKASRLVYGANPFPETVEIGRYLEKNCPPDARIAVIGSEPQIYFYSRRRAATGYICTYPLVELHPYAAKMQDEMIKEIEANHPAYVVFVWVETSWLAQPGCDGHILDWFNQYRKKQLKMVGLVEILPTGDADYRWLKPEETDATPHTTDWLAIYKNTRNAAR